jgi:nitrite reductase/ring-hydroxylating ferredoxin subunit
VKAVSTEASPARAFDLERVVCRLSDLEPQGARAFTIGAGDWPLKGFVVRAGAGVRGYVNHCPHAGHPLDLLPGRFLSPDGALILCSSHGALFEKDNGYCVAGPCAGNSLTPISLEVREGFVLLADSVDIEALVRSAAAAAE